MANGVWIAIGDKVTCPDCLARHRFVKPMYEWERIGLPGEGATVCKDFCRCVIFEEDTLSRLGEKLGIKFDNIGDLIEQFGLAKPIKVISRPLKEKLFDLGLIEIARMDYDLAKATMMTQIYEIDPEIGGLEFMSLMDILKIYENLRGK